MRPPAQKSYERFLFATELIALVNNLTVFARRVKSMSALRMLSCHRARTTCPWQRPRSRLGFQHNRSAWPHSVRISCEEVEFLHFP